MSKVGTKKFGDGLQTKRKSASDKMAKSRLKDAGKQTRQVSKAMDKVRLASLKKSQAAKPADLAKSRQPAAPGKDIPQTLQRTRPETQDQAARHGKMASEAFVKDKQDASSLKKLQSKSIATRPNEQAKTKRAVVDKGTSARLDLGKQPAEKHIPKLAKQVNETIQKQISREKAAKHLPRAKGYTKKGERAKLPKEAAKFADAQPKDAPKVAAAAKLPAMKPAKLAEGKKRAGSKTEKREGSKRKSKSSGKVAYTGDSSATKNLNAMLGGFSGGSDEGFEGDGTSHEIAKAKAVDIEKLPEEDPGFEVYSEFDTANPGIEAVKSKAQLFARHVEKKVRLEEIAQLDEQLEGKIDNLFRDRGFKERMIGDLKDEIKLADMLGSPYGGRMFRG